MKPHNRQIANIPDTLEKLLGFEAECGCGAKHSVDLAFTSIRKGATEDLIEFAGKIAPHAKTLVVADEITRHVLGERASKLLKKAGFDTKLFVLPNGSFGRPHADDETVDKVMSALEGFDLAVAAGSGTINDLVKLASFRRAIPYIAAATAPSMNGYTSAIAAIMQRGIKRTVECRQPAAVVADLDVLSAAPHHLIASGLSDLESKPTSTADFRLGGILGRSYYCKAPESVVMKAEARAAASAEGLRQSDPISIADLTEALILSGISMKLAGSSSPASGGEHLISHYFDMTAQDEGRDEGFHGAQVGVSTIVTATLYEHLKNLNPKSLDADKIIAARPSAAEMEKAVRSRHGSRSDEVIKELFSKQLTMDKSIKELKWIIANFDHIWIELDDVLRPAQRIREILSSAGSPTKISEIGLENRHLETAFIAAREIRGRYTVLDLAADLGVLKSIRDSVLRASRCLA